MSEPEFQVGQTITARQFMGNEVTGRIELLGTRYLYLKVEGEDELVICYTDSAKLVQASTDTEEPS